VQDVCVKKDFDDLFNEIVDNERELKVIHGGVVEVSYQPVQTARNVINTNPFIIRLPEQQTTHVAAPTQEDTQVNVY